MFDLISAVDLTVSAAIVVAAVAIGFGRDWPTRGRIALALGVWFVVVVVLAATEVLHSERGIGVGGVGVAVAVPILIMLVSLFRIPALWWGLEEVSLSLLTAVHAVRILGIGFVILHAEGRLPAPFAPVAGWGDIAVGLAALPVAWLVARRAPGWRATLILSGTRSASPTWPRPWCSVYSRLRARCSSSVPSRGPESCRLCPG
jgi:hypothetical protein